MAVTGDGSELDKYAESNGWLARFPMWDWVGGRTSVMCAVGLLPAALQGFDIRRIPRRRARRWTRTRATAMTRKNAADAARADVVSTPATGAAKKDMVILPYKDRLALFSNTCSSW